VNAVVDLSRIEELRRRIHRDPASIAFAQLGEEYRRAGRFEDAIEACRAGLAYHPGYLSAYVTLGRALIEAGDLAAAADALTRVHAAAPDNLAAIKGLADIRHRLGECQASLALYRRALELAPDDPDLEHRVDVVTAELAARAPTPPGPSAAPDDLGVGPEPAAEPAAETAPPPPEAAAPGTPEQVEALERWLEAVLADRDRRE
jgi:tetratricopeptide (TPR) repeat protein